MVVSKTAGPAVEMYRGALARADHEASFRAMVDAAAGRVLRAKQAFGLLRCGG
jgi:hypothetical protein